MDRPAGQDLPLTDVREAIRIAKEYVGYVFMDEQVNDLGVEETEFIRDPGRWNITVGMSRPWNAPRTRAQEVLEQIGASSSHRRSFKVVSIDQDGVVVSMKDRRD